MAEVLLKVKFPPNYPIIYKMVKLPVEMTVKASVEFITEKYALQSWIGKSKMGLFEVTEQAWLEESKSLSYYFPDISLVENIEFKDKNAVKGPLQHARGPHGDLFTPQEVEKLREKLANLGSVGKVLEKRQAVSMRVKVDDRTRLEEVQKILDEKEQDTAMAAEIGQALLEKNVQLETEISQLHTKVNEYERILVKLEEIQTENLRLRTRNLLMESQLMEASSSNTKLWEALDNRDEQLEEKNAEMKEATAATLKQRERVIKAQLAELESLRLAAEESNTTAAALQKSNIRLTEKIDLLESQVKSLKGDLLEKTDNDPTKDMKAKIMYLSTKNRSLEKKVVLLQSQSGATSDLTKGLSVLQSVISDVKTDSAATPDEDRQLIIQAKKTLDYFLENPDAPPILSHLVNQLQIPPAANSPPSDAERDAYPPTVILLIVSLFALQKHGRLEQDLQQEKILQTEVVEQLRKRLETVEKQNNKLKDLNDGIQALYNTEKSELVRKLESATLQLQTITQTKDNEILVTQNRMVEIQSAFTVKDEEISRLNREIARLKQRIQELEDLLAQQSALPTRGLVTKEIPKDYVNEEEESMVNYINYTLKGDPDLAHIVPFSSTRSILNATKDGLMVCKLINRAVPGTIDERVLNTQPESMDEVEQNNSLSLNSAKAIGCKVHSLSAASLSANPTDALDFIFEVAKVSMMTKVSLTHHPELAALASSDEDLNQFAALPPTTILHRWANHHLSLGKSKLQITSLNNLGDAVKDGILYGELLEQIGPVGVGQRILKETDPMARATAIVAAINEITPFKILDVKHILSGNTKLNLAVLAVLCDSCTKLVITEEQTTKINMTITQLLQEEDSEGSREERAFVMWINSLNIGTYITNLTSDLKDGLVVLQVLDKICPGVVPWASVNMAPNNAYKMLENCNLGVKVAKSQKLNFSLVGIDGANFHRGDRKLILALIWQACKFHILTILKTIGGGKEVSEADMTSWANGKLAIRNMKIEGFKDSTLASGVFLINLIDAVHPGVVQQTIISPGQSVEDRMLNAKYAISLTRKIGGSIFLVWEDIVEVKPKMILTLIGTLMALDAKVLL